jgi:hypothetical protein
LVSLESEDLPMTPPVAANSTVTVARRAASACLFGLALGDALAAPTEFLRDVETIQHEFGPDGPREPQGSPARVTDDTQMALCVGEALVEAQATGRPLSAATLESPLRRAFVAWMDSPDNTRAPGMTCMSACRRLQNESLPWHEASVLNSKGCGANMRVAPVGLLRAAGPNDDATGVTDTTRAAIAQFQAALTHGHPTALAASDLTAWAIADLAAGGELSDLPARLRVYALSQRTVYHADWLGPLWERPALSRPQSSSRAAGTSARLFWTGSTRPWPIRTATPTRATQPARAGWPKKRLPLACSAFCCSPTTPLPPCAGPPLPAATRTRLPA